MTQPPSSHYHHHDDPLLRKEQRHKLWQHSSVLIGLALLLAGYALLAVHPDTASQWVLLRVAAGFALLFAGFGLAILPWLTRTLNDDD